MMYMDDAIRATVEIMQAPSDAIKIRSSYNLSGVSFTPAEIAEEIKKRIPAFTITYKPDFRQKIAVTSYVFARGWPGYGTGVLNAIPNAAVTTYTYTNSEGATVACGPDYINHAVRLS